MEKLKAGTNYSINANATIPDPKTGVPVSAKDILCAEAPAAILALEAAKALTQNFILKLFFGLVSSAVEALVASLCAPVAEKK